MLETDADRRLEDAIAEACCKAWRCSWGSMGPYSPFDKYFYSDRGMLAIAEIKARANRDSHSFSTALLNLDKYLALFTAELGLGIKSLYLLGFPDGVFAVRIGTIDLSKCRISVKGRGDRPGVKNDIRPAIEIPLSEFKQVSTNGIL